MAYIKVPGVTLGKRIYYFRDGSDIPNINVASDAPSTRNLGMRIM
jgi:hypothetical protein